MAGGILLRHQHWQRNFHKYKTLKYKKPSDKKPQIKLKCWEQTPVSEFLNLHHLCKFKTVKNICMEILKWGGESSLWPKAKWLKAIKVKESAELNNRGIYGIVFVDQWEGREKPIQYLGVKAWAQKRVWKGEEWVKEMASKFEKNGLALPSYWPRTTTSYMPKLFSSANCGWTASQRGCSLFWSLLEEGTLMALYPASSYQRSRGLYIPHILSPSTCYKHSSVWTTDYPTETFSVQFSEL